MTLPIGLPALEQAGADRYVKIDGLARKPQGRIPITFDDIGGMSVKTDATIDSELQGQRGPLQT